MLSGSCWLIRLGVVGSWFALDNLAVGVVFWRV